MDVISDEFWAVVEPLLPSAEGKRGRRWRDHREVLEAIAWRYRTGCPWRDLPEDAVPWQTAWKRHRRWSTGGTYAAMLAALQAAYGIDPAGAEDSVQALLSVDSTGLYSPLSSARSLSQRQHRC